MPREREKRGVEDDIVSWPGQLEEWSCQLTEMRNNESVEEEQELRWRHIDFEMPIRQPREEVQCTVRYLSQDVMGDLQTGDIDLAALCVEMMIKL